MSNASVDQAIQEFFKAPRVQHYLDAQQAIFAADGYDPSARQVVALESRVVAKQFKGHNFDSFPSEFQLCPRWHYLRARIAEHELDSAGVRLAVQHMQLCLRAIAETGDGDKLSPYRITFLTDADDLVRAFGESVRFQQLVGSSQGYRDVVTAHSGVDFWFDVESLLERTSQEAALARTVR